MALPQTYLYANKQTNKLFIAIIDDIYKMHEQQDVIF